jgi:hypothetical protein
MTSAWEAADIEFIDDNGAGAELQFRKPKRNRRCA